MALSIKNQEVDRLARELAKETGETVTVAIRVALEERLRRRRGRSDGSLRAQLEAIGKRCSRLPVLDSRRPEEILGYDRSGLPR